MRRTIICSRGSNRRFHLGDAEDFHDFVAQVVDDFHGDATGFGFGEGAGGVAVEGGPGFFVDFGFESGLEGFIGVVLA